VKGYLMKPRLSNALVQLREQFDDSFPKRDRKSDGWLGDARHSATISDHNPDANGWVRALDVDADLDRNPESMAKIVNQIRKRARKDGRLNYIIFNGRIASRKSLWVWTKYRGINPHRTHAHFSALPTADRDNKFWNIPLLGGTR
jgi:hypothetical protein